MSDKAKSLSGLGGVTPLRLFKLFVVFGFPLFGILYFYQYTGQDRDLVVPFKTFQAPAETVVESPEGQKLKLEFKQPVTVVNFWATWCPPCVEEFPAMVELQRQLEGKGVEIVFVSVDDSWDKVRQFLASNRIDVQPGRLFLDKDKLAAKAWGSEKFPETYVLRRDGWVVEKIIGAQQWTRPAVIEYFANLGSKFRKL